MRVTRVNSVSNESSGTGERGIALVFVAITLVVLCGAAAISIDLGNGWVTRRNLVTATDAAAFAAAQEFVSGGDGCDAIDDEYVGFNNPSATGVTCDMTGSDVAGAVTVYAEDNVNTWFASIIGQGDFLANSASTVRWGGAGAVTGLRPIALCAEAPGIENWIANPSLQVTVRVNFSNDGQPDICNNGTNVPGNWGLLDFDGVGGNDTKEWVENGYPGEVNAGSPDADCDAEPWACYPPQTGELTQVKKELEDLIGVEITLPVINYAEDSGGSTTQFHIMGFAHVIIEDLKLTGNDSGRFIEITFLPGLVQGPCCSDTGGPSNVVVIGQCAVDNRNLDACEP